VEHPPCLPLHGQVGQVLVLDVVVGEVDDDEIAVAVAVAVELDMMVDMSFVVVFGVDSWPGVGLRNSVADKQTDGALLAAHTTDKASKHEPVLAWKGKLPQRILTAPAEVSRDGAAVHAARAVDDDTVRTTSVVNVCTVPRLERWPGTCTEDRVDVVGCVVAHGSLDRH
jgi:hypothetical protein